MNCIQVIAVLFCPETRFSMPKTPSTLLMSCPANRVFFRANFLSIRRGFHLIFGRCLLLRDVLPQHPRLSCFTSFFAPPGVALDQLCDENASYLKAHEHRSDVWQQMESLPKCKTHLNSAIVLHSINFVMIPPAASTHMNNEVKKPCARSVF